MQTKPLTLNRVEIKRNPSYESSNPNRFIAEIEYQSGGSELKLLLDPGVSEQILGFIGPVITKFATKAAQDVEANIAQAV